jgi:hypothetical protein
MENSVVSGGSSNDSFQDKLIHGSYRRPTYQSLSQKVLRNYILPPQSATSSVSVSAGTDSTPTRHTKFISRDQNIIHKCR